jgi:hypothetical protein
MTTHSDEANIDMLAIFHYVVGAFMALFSLFPLIYLVFGMFFIFAPDITNNSQPSSAPEFVGYIFIVIGIVFVLIGEALAFSVIYSGRQLQKKQKRMFSFIIACIMCFFVPFGTILGVFTIVVLSKDSVIALYNREQIYTIS